MKTAYLLLVTVFIWISLTGCQTAKVAPSPLLEEEQYTSLLIESDPPQAYIRYSKSEKGPWDLWKEKTGHHVTPSKAPIKVGEFYWFKVAKEGYAESKPSFLRVDDVSPQHLVFKLEKLPEIQALEKTKAGYIFFKGEWVKPEEKGLVEYKGEWVDPKEAGLVQYKNRLVKPEEEGLVKYKEAWVDPEEEGLIPYRGYWVKPEEEGLVYYENRWMTPEERDQLAKAKEPSTPPVIPAEIKIPVEKVEGIKATGFAPIINDNIAQARQAALADALNQALQQHLGLNLKSTRIASNYILLKYRIETESKGAIASYQIIDEGQSQDFYKVRVLARFRQDEIKKRNLDQVKVVLLNEDPESPPSDSTQSVIESLQESFLEYGFRVMPAGLVTDDLDYEKGVPILVRPSADLVMTISTEADLADKFGNFYVYQVTARGKVIKAITGELLIEREVQLRGTRELSQGEARKSACKASAKELADKLVGDLVDRYGKCISHRIIVGSVTTQGQVDLLRRNLAGIPGVKSVRMLEFNRPFVTFEVELTPEANASLPEKINRMEDMHVTVVKSSGSETLALVRL